MDGGGINNVWLCVPGGVFFCRSLHIPVEVSHVQNPLFAISSVGPDLDKYKGDRYILCRVFLPERIVRKPSFGWAMFAVGAKDYRFITRLLQILRKIIVPPTMVKVHAAGIVVHNPDVFFHFPRSFLWC